MRPSDWVVTTMLVACHLVITGMVLTSNGVAMGVAYFVLPILCVAVASGLDAIDRRFG